MGMITFICAYKPCSKEVTYAKVGHGRVRKYCCDLCRNRNRKNRAETVAKFQEVMAQRAANFRAEGLCVSCGQPVVEGKLHCYEHLRYYRQRTREIRKKARSG